jgi:hypothetical protein
MRHCVSHTMYAAVAPGYATAARPLSGRLPCRLLREYCTVLTLWHQLLHLCCKVGVELCSKDQRKKAAAAQRNSDACMHTGY